MKMIRSCFGHKKRPTEFYLSHLLDLNFVYHDNKEENVKDLNDLIQAIEKYRDSL